MMYKYTRYWLTDAPASEGVDAHVAGQIFDFGQTGEEGMMWFEGHGPSEGYATIEGNFSDECYRVNVKTGVPYAWEPPPKKLPPDLARRVVRQGSGAADVLRQMLLDNDDAGIDAYVDQKLNGVSPSVKNMIKDILKYLAAKE